MQAYRGGSTLQIVWQVISLRKIFKSKELWIIFLKWVFRASLLSNAYPILLFLHVYLEWTTTVCYMLQVLELTEEWIVDDYLWFLTVLNMQDTTIPHTKKWQHISTTQKRQR